MKLLNNDSEFLFVCVALSHKILNHDLSEEMSEEVQDRMLSIQKREGEQLAELTEFLDSEMSFVTVYYDMLLKLKQEWPSAYVINQNSSVARGYLPCTTISASANTKKLTHRRSLTKRPNDDSPRPSNEQSFTVRTRSKSTVNEGAVISIFATPPDVQDRKRSDSVATAESKDKSETAPPTPKSRKTSVSGWVGSFSRSRKNSSVSKKNFQSLLDDEEANQTTPTAPTFFRSSALALDDTPSTELRDRKPSNGERVRRSSVARRPPTLRKIRAMHDMINHAPDELPFRTGETLTVLDPSFTGDVEDTMTWVRAEREGYVGMVPLNYFEVLPRLTHKTSNTRKPTVGYFGNDGGSSETEDPESPSSSLLHDYGDTVLVSSKRRGPGANDVFRHYEPATTDNFTRNRYDDDDEHPFNDPVYDDSEQAHATRMENFLGFEPTAYLKAKKAAASSSSDRSRGSDELDTNNNNNPSSSFPNLLSPPNTTSTSKGRPFRTAPPSPNRPPAPIPTSSSRQLPQNVANAVAAAASGKKPPPPPPPTRRAQSSTNITQGHGKGGSVNGSVSSLSSLTGGAREPPPPPPMRRPTQQGRESESPFN